MIIDNTIITNPYAALLPETDIDNSIIRSATPAGLHHLYRLGLVNGVIIDTEKTPYPYNKYAKYNFDALKSNQKDGQSIIFEDTKYYPKIRGSGKGKRILNQKNYLQLDAKSSVGAQVTGDCVSWAIRDALDQLRANRIILKGLFEAWIARQATALIYRSRGYNGQGADPVELSANAIELGTLLEIAYDIDGTKYDFTVYENYVRWGMSGSSRIPADLLTRTKPYHAGIYKVVATTDGLLDLMANDGTAHCGSDLGVSNYGNPVSKRSGSWSHDMNIAGVDDTDWCKDKYGGRIWIWNQSWGNWNSVENIPDEWKPWGQGQFALNDKDTQWAVNDGGTVAFFDGEFFSGEPLENKII